MLTREQQIACYGETEEQMLEAYRLSLGGSDFQTDCTMYAMSILSDAQEVLTNNLHGEKSRETARQWINKAKYFIGKVHADLRARGM